MRSFFGRILGRVSAIALVIVLVAGCGAISDLLDPGPNRAGPGEVVSAELVQATADDLNLPGLAEHRLTKLGDFRRDGQYFTVANLDGTELVALEELASAVDVVLEQRDTTFEIPFLVPGQEGLPPLIYNVTVAPEREHLLVYAAVAKVSDLASQAGYDGSSIQGSFTARKTGYSGTYVLTLLGDQGAETPALGIPQVPINTAATYVELCQSTVRVQPTQDTRDSIQALPGAEQYDASVMDNLIVRIGQQAFCSSLGASIGFARSGVSYTDYVAALDQRGLDQLHPVIVPFRLVDEETYAGLK